jgi:hypothetical protein
MLETFAIKIVYSLVIVVVLIIGQAILSTTSNLGWFWSFLLVGIYYWSVFFFRKAIINRLLSVAGGVGDDHDSRMGRAARRPLRTIADVAIIKNALFDDDDDDDDKKGGKKGKKGGKQESALVHGHGGGDTTPGTTDQEQQTYAGQNGQANSNGYGAPPVTPGDPLGQYPAAEPTPDAGGTPEKPGFVDEGYGYAGTNEYSPGATPPAVASPGKGEDATAHATAQASATVDGEHPRHDSDSAQKGSVAASNYDTAGRGRADELREERKELRASDEHEQHPDEHEPPSPPTRSE